MESTFCKSLAHEQPAMEILCWDVIRRGKMLSFPYCFLFGEHTVHCFGAKSAWCQGHERHRQGHGAQMDIPRRAVKVPLHLVKNYSCLVQKLDFLATQQGFLSG